MSVIEVQRIVTHWLREHPVVVLETSLDAPAPLDPRDAYSPVTHAYVRGRRVVMELDTDQDSTLVVIAGVEYVMASSTILEFPRFEYGLVAAGDRGPLPRLIEGGIVRLHEPTAFLRRLGIVV